MAHDALPAGLVTFVFTDVEGSTALQAALGDGWPPLIRRHHAVLTAAVTRHGGVVVKTLGDGVFAAFADAAAAARAAQGVRHAVRDTDWGVALRVRVGLHTGPAAPHDGDYAALAASVAARVCAAAHGGQVLASDDTAAAPPPAGCAWRDLGAYVLPGLDQPVRLRALDDGTGEQWAPRAVPAARHNVPASRTAFVGRARELDALAALVRTERLVSVLGPGGTGKTRLAFELARRLSGACADGAWVVLLADLPAGGEVADRVAATLGVRAAGGQGVAAALASWAAAHDALVVLDNCEHVTGPVARLLHEVAGDGVRARFLATSRAALRLPGEVEWRLAPLPDAPDEDAVRLFLDRARLARPDADLTGRRDDVAEVCRRLDGLPLAIELAAARLRHASLDALLATVRERVGGLAAPAYGVDQRHHSLQALLDWGHDLLTDEERVVLRRCAVFHAPFAAADAAEVCDVAGAEDVLWRLADRSLVEVTADAPPRFRLLWTIRDYAAARLRDAGEQAAVADRHARWVTARAVPLAAHGSAAMAAYAAVHDDAVAALAHLAEADDPGLPVLACAMFDYWVNSGTYATGVAWLRLAGERGDARSLARAGMLLDTMRRPAEARPVLAQAVAMARAAGDPAALAECLVRSGANDVFATGGRAGEEACLEALAIAEAAPRDRSGALLILGSAAYFRGDHDAALRRYAEVVALGASPTHVAAAQGDIAEILIERGELAEATALLTAALPVVEGRDASPAAWLCQLLHRAALAEGDRDAALAWLDRGLRTVHAAGADDTDFGRELRALRDALA